MSYSFANPWTIACQAPLSLGFSRQEYWSGLPFPSLRDFPYPGVKPMSPAWQMASLPLSCLGSPKYLAKSTWYIINWLMQDKLLSCQPRLCTKFRPQQGTGMVLNSRGEKCYENNQEANHLNSIHVYSHVEALGPPPKISYSYGNMLLFSSNVLYLFIQ